MESRNSVSTYCAGFRYLASGISYLKPSGLVGSVYTGVSTYSVAGFRYLGTGISYLNPSVVVGSVCNGISAYSVAGYRYLGTGINYIIPVIWRSIHNGGLKAFDIIKVASGWEMLRFVHATCTILYYPGPGFLRAIDILLLTAPFFQQENFTACPSSLPEENHPETNVGTDS